MKKNKPVGKIVQLAGEDVSVLKEAKDLVHGERNRDYGSPKEDFSRTAKMWSAILGMDIQPHQVAMCMICVKLSRMCQSPKKRDHVVDIVGYAECYQMCMEDE